MNDGLGRTNEGCLLDLGPGTTVIQSPSGALLSQESCYVSPFGHRLRQRTLPMNACCSISEQFVVDSRPSLRETLMRETRDLLVLCFRLQLISATSSAA
jgi:hypothetical protein